MLRNPLFKYSVAACNAKRPRATYVPDQMLPITDERSDRARQQNGESFGRRPHTRADARRQPGPGTTFILFRALSQVAGELNRRKNFRHRRKRVRVSQINALAHTQMQHKNPLSKAQRRMSDRISCAHPHSHTHMLRIQCLCRCKFILILASTSLLELAETTSLCRATAINTTSTHMGGVARQSLVVARLHTRTHTHTRVHNNCTRMCAYLHRKLSAHFRPTHTLMAQSNN